MQDSGANSWTVDGVNVKCVLKKPDDPFMAARGMGCASILSGE